MPTGLEIRREVCQKRPELGWASTTTGAGSTLSLVDARLAGKGISSGYFGEAFVHISGGTAEKGHSAKVHYLDPGTGTLYFEPAAPGAVASGVTYEVTRHGLRSDDLAAARDRALTQRCSIARLKPLSLVSDVEDWTNQVGTVTLAQQTLGFPVEYFEQALRVTADSDAEGVESETYEAVADQRLHLFGLCAVSSGVMVPKIRNVTAGSDIDLAGGAGSYSVSGWRTFHYTATVPSGCRAVRARFVSSGGAATFDLAGVGLLTHGRRFQVPRVKSRDEVGDIYQFDFGDQVTADEMMGWEVFGAKRFTPGNAVMLEFPSGLTLPTYYEERHLYSALQSSYTSASDRNTGDAASTDCELPFVEAATVVELLENVKDDPVLNRVYLAAEKDLSVWAQRLAMPVRVPVEPSRHRPRVMRL